MESKTEEIDGLLKRAKSGDVTLYARLGTLLFQAGRIDECGPWLEKAASAGDLPALNLYGLMHLNGIGVGLNFNKAIKLLESAATAGLKEASYTLAGMYANGFGMDQDFQLAWRYLVQAGRRGHVPAYRAAGILLAAGGESPEVSLSLLRYAAKAGDGLAQACLAEYLGIVGGDGWVSEASYWARLATERNLPTAARSLVALAAAPGSIADAVGEMSWDELERSCPPQRNTRYAVRTVVPDIVFVADDVLPNLIRDYLINVAAPRLTPSNVVDPVTGNAVKNPVRSSHSMFFSPNMYDMVLGYVGNTIAALAEVPIRHSEPLTVLRYGPGQEYKPHMDYLVGSATGEQMDARGGQRVVTAFVYLNDVEQGGETEFPELKAIIKPARGRAVKFYNLDESGLPNPMTLHAGCPVVKGEKWLATFWFRQRPFAWGNS